MTLYLIKKKATYDITQAVTKYTWSGSLDQASRALDFSLVNAPLDKNLSGIPMVAMGDFVKLKDGSNTVFYGMVYTSEKTSAIGDVTYTCYDLLYHLTKSSWSKSFKDTTAEAIAKVCCKEVGIPVGSLATTKIKLAKLLIDSETLYDTILKAYNKASLANGKKYHIRMNGKKLDVKEKGYIVGKVMLTDATNLTQTSVKESATDIINRVKIYDDKGNQTGVVANSKSVSKYGVFQAVYKKQDGVDSKKAAKEGFKEPTQEITLEAIGNIACMSGYAVYIKDEATGLIGKYWIMDDQHTFENGVHTMSLTLSFKNLMSTSEITYSEEDS